MLERASSCIEPAAQNLFRSIEAPTRSRRRLPQAFWRYTRTAQEHKSWWPAYLDDIRRASQAREGGSDGGILAPRAAAGAFPFAQQQWISTDNAAPHSKPKQYPTNRRHISKVVRQSDSAAVETLEEAVEHENESPPAEVTLFAPEGIPEPRKPRVEMTAGERLQELLRAGGEPKFNAVWLAFISLKEQSGFARAVLRYLSRSPSPVVLRRALRTFQMIEVEDRTNLTYESAVKAAVGLHKYTIAHGYVLEGLQRGLGVESSQSLMGHLVEKEMWNSVLQALHVYLKHAGPENDDKSSVHTSVSHHTRESSVWKTVDTMLSLPQKLIALCKRLKGGDAVLASDAENIQHLASRLLQRTLRSPTIMSDITPKGVLALLDSYRDLGLLRLGHYLDALSALRVLRDTRNRSQLALMIFRNMRLHYPAHGFNNSTYGTMISILSACPNEPESFEYILTDLTRGHASRESKRKCDAAMYQRVMWACAEQGYTTYVRKLLGNLIRDHGEVRDLTFLTPLLLSSAKRGDVESTRSAFDELSSKHGLTPNSHCWNILLLAYAKAGNFEGAAALFTQMRNLGVMADSYTFGTLMSICSNAGDTEGVLQLVEMARRQQIPATAAMIDTIVHSYCMNTEVQDAESLVEAATQMSVSGSKTRMWNILLRHYAFRGDSVSVLRIQERMRELAVKPDGMTYAALMTSLVVAGNTKHAAAILRSLHLSQILTASRFHYSIVFHGYVQEGQRDQAIVIYTEMLERFSRPSPSARLAMLHLQSRRDEDQAQQRKAVGAARWAGDTIHSASAMQSHSIDFLADALLEMTDSEALPQEPQPGFQRRNPAFAATGIHLEVPLNLLYLSSSYDKAAKLVSHYKAVLEASSMNMQQKSYQTVELLTAHLRGLVRNYETSAPSRIHLREFSRKRLDSLWSQILDETISNARKRNLSLLDNSALDTVLSRDTTSLVDAEITEDGQRSEPVTPSDDSDTITPSRGSFRAIPAKRFALSKPLSAYMRGLAFQGRFPTMESILDLVQDLGFELTSKNWNTYIQLLTQRRDKMLLAFRLFEQKLLPNAPPWELLKRGKVLEVSFVQSSPADLEAANNRDAFFRRTTLEKRSPGQLLPTYFTVIHMAAALLRAYRMPTKDGDEIILYREIQQHAPGTVKFLMAMPHLKDRVQGVLLRGMAVKGDPLKRPREAGSVDRTGLLGSQSLLERMSPELLDILEQTETTEEDLQAIAEDIDGPIVHEKLIAARRKVLESADAHEKRLLSQKKNQKLRMQQLQTEIKDRAVRTVSSKTYGDPYVSGLPIRDYATKLRATRSEQQVKFEEQIESLRALANEYEPLPPPWKIRSTWGKKVPLRITAYPWISSQSDFFKPVGDFKHRNPAYTKPMLNMVIPRRRELGSERRAYDLPKKWMDLKRQRAKLISKAQARTRKMKRRQQGKQEPQPVQEPQDVAFLEKRLVGEEEVSEESAENETAAEPRTDVEFLAARLVEVASKWKNIPDSDTSMDADDASLVEVPSEPVELREQERVESEGRSGEASDSNVADKKDLPFVPWDGFDEKDLVDIKELGNRRD